MLVKVAYFETGEKLKYNLGTFFVFVYLENSDWQVNGNVNRISYKIHFPNTVFH